MERRIVLSSSEPWSTNRKQLIKSRLPQKCFGFISLNNEC
jgi:hypothetical protein